MKSISVSVPADMVKTLGIAKAGEMLSEGMAIDIYKEAHLEPALLKVLLEILKDLEEEGIIDLYRSTREPLEFTLEFGKLPLKISEGNWKATKVIEPDPRDIVEAAMYLMLESVGSKVIQKHSRGWRCLRDACNKYAEDEDPS